MFEVGFDPHGLHLPSVASYAKVSVMTEERSAINDLTEALESALDDASWRQMYATCPYLLKNGEEGAYGPNTCHAGCSQEPVCVTGSFTEDDARDPVVQAVEEVLADKALWGRAPIEAEIFLAGYLDLINRRKATVYDG